jgi:hypothetical protein
VVAAINSLLELLKVQDLADFNRCLLAFCLAEQQRTVSGQSQSIGERFETERLHAIALPAHRFDPCVTSMVVVDKYQTVRFQTNRYSVPKWAAFQPATVKAYVDRVEIVQTEKRMAIHPRSYGRDESILEPLHYLAALGTRPGALDHSGVFKGWKLPPIFAQLRGIHGVRVLMGLVGLARRHSREAMEDACRVAQSHGCKRLRDIRNLLKQSAPAVQEQFEFVASHPLIRPLSDYSRLIHFAFERTRLGPPQETRL